MGFALVAEKVKKAYLEICDELNELSNEFQPADDIDEIPLVGTNVFNNLIDKIKKYEKTVGELNIEMNKKG